jgi:phage terminase large subunit
MSSAHISIIPEFISKIESLQLENVFEITKNEIINKLSGSSILFRGIKTSSGLQTANLKSISGITTFIIDEAEELIDEDVFNKIDLSIRTKDQQNRVIVIMNPTTKEHFIYKRFFEDVGVPECSNITKGDTTYIHSSYLDNLQHINESLLREIQRIKETNPSKYEHIMMGKWLDRAEGVIFSNWEIDNWKATDKILYGSDFGFSIDPSTCIAVSFDNDIIYLKEIFYKPGMITSDFVIEYKQLPRDVLIIADSAEPRLIEEINKSNINIKPISKKPGSVAEGITFMKDYKMVVDPGSINIIRELNNYAWSNSKAGIPIDNYNHAIDAIRYVIMWDKQHNQKFDYDFAFT